MEERHSYRRGKIVAELNKQTIALSQKIVKRICDGKHYKMEPSAPQQQN
jgi:hypothetical protein